MTPSRVANRGPKLSSSIVGCMFAIVVWITTVTVGFAADSTTYIVQGDSADTAAAVVRSVCGEVTRELRIIRAVGAALTDEQADTIRSRSDVKIFEDRSLTSSAL